MAFRANSDRRDAGWRIAAALVVCLAIGAANSPGADIHPQPQPSKNVPRLMCILIGGMDSDPTPEQITGKARRDMGNSGLYRLRDDLSHERVVAEYFNWNGTRAGELAASRPPRTAGIARFIRQHIKAYPRDRLALVGNSWGGHTALEVAWRLYRHETPLALDLVVFVDPSSLGRSLSVPLVLPDNVNRAIHYRTRNLFVWGRMSGSPRIEDIDLGDAGQGYMHEGRPAYAAPFDFRAHVAAEWDEKIHADIRRRLLDVTPQVPSPGTNLLSPSHLDHRTERQLRP